PGGPNFPYHLRDHLLSPAELNFYKTINGIISDKAFICSKVNLNDIFYVKQNDASRFRIYTNKIDRKHVDFLLCDPITMQPLVAIELDDRSHQRKDRQERDSFVDSVFEAAGLPLIHVTARRSYQLDALRSQLRPYITVGNANRTNIETNSVEIDSYRELVAPCCPKCGSRMVLRTSKKGKNAGNQFWGCSGYPQCRTIIELEV
ncbi:MAG: DUF2726 domain-containing protein, partial [Anaerolineae bacterium]|nr:DUF2726 domain-containing protein [Anaerolineae bacterium]